MQRSQPERRVKPPLKSDVCSDESQLYNFVRVKPQSSGLKHIRIKQPAKKGGEKSSCESFEQVFHKRNLSLRAQQCIRETFENKIRQLTFQPPEQPAKNSSLSYILKLKLRKTFTSKSRKQRITSVKNSKAHAQSFNDHIDTDSHQQYKLNDNKTAIESNSLEQLIEKRSAMTPHLKEANFNITKTECLHPVVKKYLNNQLPLSSFVRQEEKENQIKTEPIRRQNRIGFSVQLTRNPKTQNYVNELFGRISSIGVQENDFTPWKSDDENDNINIPYIQKRLR